MVTIEINGWRFALTEGNESVVKKILSKYPLETKVTIIETGEILKINDIFDYERKMAAPLKLNNHYYEKTGKEIKRFTKTGI